MGTRFSRRAFLRDATAAAGLLAFRSAWMGNLLDGVAGPEMHARFAGATSGRAALSSLTPPPIVSRAEWGADESLRRGSPRFTPPRKLVVHHTATNLTGDFTADVREVYRMHLTRDGGSWTDVGYQFMIDPTGRVYEGRWARDYAPGENHDGHDPFGRVVRGAHALGCNSGTLGIALLGNYEGAAPPDAMVGSLVELLTWLCASHGLDPHGTEPFVDDHQAPRSLPTILGHRDVKGTACPGQTTYNLIPRLRDEVARRLGELDRDPGGAWLLDADGGVHTYGTAAYHGSIPELRGQTGAPSNGAVAIAPTSTGRGYWVLDRVGAVFPFGDAADFGSLPPVSPPVGSDLASADLAVAIAPTPTGDGYWVLDWAGGVHNFGAARYRGSLPELQAQGDVGWSEGVALRPTASGDGYWILDRAGGVHAFGDASFHGSLGTAGAPTGDSPVDLRPTPSGRGYWILDRFGGVFSFGDAEFHGSAPAAGFAGAAARTLAPAPDGAGYLVLCDDGAVLKFGDTNFHGHGPRYPIADLAAAA